MESKKSGGGGDKKKKPPRPLKILANLLQKKKTTSKASSESSGNGGSASTKDRNDNAVSHSPPIITTDAMSASSMFLDASSSAGGNQLYTEMEALTLSRCDNPFVLRQSQDNLDAISLARCGSQSVFSGTMSGSQSHQLSPEPPYSPTKSVEAISELHSHMVRSPPPIDWPLTATGPTGFPASPRSNDSSDGLEHMEYNSLNYYTRSHSEEHILSPGGLSLGGNSKSSAAFSPVRGTTPEHLMTMSLYAGAGAGADSAGTGMGAGAIGALASPRNPRGGSGSVKVKRNDTSLSVAMAAVGSTEEGSSPFRNMSYDCGAASSASTYAISHLQPSPSVAAAGGSGYCSLQAPHAALSAVPRRSFGAKGPFKKVSGDSFFSSWRLSGGGRSRRASESHHQAQFSLSPSSTADAKSLECLGLPSGGTGDYLRSPASRKSLCSVSGGVSPRNGPTLFTRYSVPGPAPTYSTSASAAAKRQSSVGPSRGDSVTTTGTDSGDALYVAS